MYENQPKLPPVPEGGGENPNKVMGSIIVRVEDLTAQGPILVTVAQRLHSYANNDKRSRNRTEGVPYLPYNLEPLVRKVKAGSKLGFRDVR